MPDAIGPGRQAGDASGKLAVAGARELWLGGDMGSRKTRENGGCYRWRHAVYRENVAEEAERKAE